MKRNKKILFLIVVLLALALSACGGDEEAVFQAQFTCNNTECVMSVHNLTDEALDYSIELLLEPEGNKIGERLQYPNTDAERHESWFYQFQRVFSHSDTLAEDETESYIVEIGEKAVGQTLVMFRVTIGRDRYDYFTIIDAHKPIDGAPPIVNSLNCNSSEIVARTTLAEGTGEKIVGLYMDQELETTHTTFVVADGSYAEIRIPTPEGVKLVELDVVGHKDGWEGSTIPEPHQYRAFCVIP